MTTKDKLNKAWVVRWIAYGDDERILHPRGVTGDIIDILSARHDFDKYIVPYAKNLYRQKLLSMTERFRLAHYNYRSAEEKMFGSAVPVFTHYSSQPYVEFSKCFSSDATSPECKELAQGWRAGTYPLYIIVGHNPAVEIKMVRNLVIEEVDGLATLTWDEPLNDGSSKQCTQTTPDLTY